MKVTKTLKICSLTGAFFYFAFIQAQAVIVTDFGTPAFLVDTTVTDFIYTQNSTAAICTGTDVNYFAGTFTPFDSTGYTTFLLTAAITGPNPGSQFAVELYNTALTDYRLYDGFMSSFGSGPTTVTLNFVSQTAAFNDIAGFMFYGIGAFVPLTITFYHLEAIPEPHTYALLACGLGVLLIARKRRKVA